MNKLFSLMILLIFISSVYVEGNTPRSRLTIQTLDNYIVSLNVDSQNNARVVQSFDIVNRYREPIIPGRAKMVLFGNLDPTNIEISIGGSRRPLPDDSVIIEDGNRVIYYEIWRPIDMGEKLNVELTFNTQINPQGVLFKQLSMNFGEPDLIIEKMALSVSLPPGRRLTYSNLPVSSTDGNSVLIEVPKDMVNQDEPITIEYSNLPLPLLPFHGYWLWLSLIVMSGAIMFLKIISKKKIENSAIAS